jgi:twitching motility protein PilT
MLAGTLKGVVSQRLVPTVDGNGRVAVCEILRVTGRARDMITDPDQTDRLREVIAEGEYYGMQTFDQALLKHFQAGRVSMDDALRVATSPHDFKLLVAGDGRTSTSMADVGEAAQRAAAAGSGHGPAASPAGSPPPPHSSPAPVDVSGPSRNGTSAPPPGI